MRELNRQAASSTGPREIELFKECWQQCSVKYKGMLSDDWNLYIVKPIWIVIMNIF